MKKRLKIIAYILLITTIICSIIYIAKYYYDLSNAKKETNLLNEVIINEALLVDTSEENEIIEPVKNERILKVEELRKENNDIIGWIEIENTNINYPVLQCSNNDFYMNHDYKKNYSMAGSIFLDKAYSWNIPSSNLLIYGHNMKNGTMFENLLNYKNYDYYSSHPNIRFTTNAEDATFEIISVFPSRTYYKSEENVFRYYFFINAKDENDFNNFVNNAKKYSLYDTGKTAQYGDQLMTLSTCAYHTDDGKFVVVAKKIE